MFDVVPPSGGGGPDDAWEIILRLWEDYIDLAPKAVNLYKTANPKLNEQSYLEFIREFLINQYPGYKNNIEALENPFAV